MKKVLLLSIFLIFGMFCCNMAQAEIKVTDYMSHEFLDTQGYSDEMLRLVDLNKAKTFGQTLPKHQSSNPLVRGWMKFWAYLDPADDVGDYGYHNINVRSTIWDY